MCEKIPAVPARGAFLKLVKCGGDGEYRIQVRICCAAVPVLLAAHSWWSTTTLVAFELGCLNFMWACLYRGIQDEQTDCSLCFVSTEGQCKPCLDWEDVCESKRDHVYSAAQEERPAS